jgi:hypothetical protein
MIFHDGRVHWPLTRTTGGPLVPVQLRDMRHEPVISEFGGLRLRRRPEHLGRQPGVLVDRDVGGVPAVIFMPNGPWFNPVAQLVPTIVARRTS